MRLVLVLVMVALASAGTMAWSESARWLWSYTFACADCVAVLPATVEEVAPFPNSVGEPPETTVTLDLLGDRTTGDRSD